MGEIISAASHDQSHSSFVVDMKPFSHFVDSNSTIAVDSCYLYNAKSRCLRGLYQENDRSGIEKRGSAAPATRDTSAKTAASTLHGGGRTPADHDKPSTVAVGSTDHSHHHQITITTTNGTAGVESKWAATKRLSFRRSWTCDPRRILLFFATLSSMGTILLIYFTLSLGHLNGNENNASISSN